MLRTALKRLNLSEGERSLLLAYMVVAFFGAGISFTIVNQLGGSKGILRPMSVYDFWMVFAGLSGAAAGLFAGRNWLGHAGKTGLSQMLIAIVLVSFVAAIVGGTLALPFYGTMFGPFLFCVTLWSNPVLACFWVATLVAAHVLFRIWRNERDSIFRDFPKRAATY